MEIRFRPLRAEEVEVRVGTCSERGASLLLYKDARCDMSLLDEVVGPENWECSYDSIDGKLFCTVSVRVDDGDGNSRWVSKQDVGVPSNMEATKGEASDAFKRACFKWGIGRELYTAPFIWVGKEKLAHHSRNDKSGRWQCYDDFSVVELEVEDGQIVKLAIVNDSNRGATVYGQPPKGEPKDAKQPARAPQSAAKRRMWEAIKKWAELHGRTPESVLEGVRKRPDWAEDEAFYETVASEFEADLP